MNPRVLHVVNSRSHESIPLELAQRLPSAGVETAVATYYRGEAGAPSVSDDIEWFPLDASGRVSAGAATRFRAAVRDFKPDIVHVHHFPSAQMAAVLLGGRRAPKLVKTEHNDHRRQPFHQNAAVLPVFARSARVLCNSQATLESFYPWERVLVRGRAVAALNGVDVERVRRAEKVEVPLDGFVIAAVGRCVPQKNLSRLIDAFSIAGSAEPDLRLVVVGGGRQEAALRRQIANLGLAEAVHVTGIVPRDTVYGILRTADAAVVPSLWEGFCNAAVEAMAAGLPLAASDLPVLREVLGDVPSYFDPTDVEALASALVSLRRRTDDSGARRGVLRATEGLSLDAAARRYADSYRDLAGEGPPR
ncbi:MAG: glycosyltransferase [Acidimicrobiales bacterium]